MAVQVHVPVTVEVPQRLRLAGADLAQLEVGTGDALARALDVVRVEVLEARGRERAVSVGEASLRFDDGVDERLRPDLALALQRAVDYAVARSGLRSWYRPSGPPGVLGGTPAVWADPSRRDEEGYRIQMFDDGSPVTVTFDPDEEDTIYGRRPGPLTSTEAAARAWEAHVDRFGAEWNPATYGYPGYYGEFTHEGQSLTQALLYIYTVGRINEDGWPLDSAWQIGEFAMLRHVDEGDSIVRSALQPAMGHWVLTRTEETTDYTNVLRRLEERQNAAPEAERLPEPVRQRMARMMADYATAYPGAAIWTVEDGSSTSDVCLQAATEGTWGIAHSPVRFITAESMPGTEGDATGSGSRQEGAGSGDDSGSGDGGDGGGQGGQSSSGRGRGSGRGPGGGPLGTAEGHGSVWPVVGNDGEALVCEPFLGEPPVAQLAVGAEALEAEMRDLAAALELEYCGYAGQLCLNLARVVGTRAHAIGITSITSTVTTAVRARPDGGGNNGFVEVQPGSAPELEYMKLLADIAVRVNNLANNISRTYLARANYDLIYWDEEHEFEPSAASWSLRFWHLLSDIMPSSMMWLFAETCRVILLQQLRSSHAGIVARQAQFAETRRRFDEALGILGGSVVKLAVLKHAVAHADRYDLSGPVRQVLSHLPPVRYIGREREPYQPPAPIESMSTHVIDVLEAAGATIEAQGDGHVARYDNRTWTTSDLEQGVGLRRSILNLADPLFNQVADLERLYHEFQRNPSSSETYLRNLLRQMRDANEEMTRETSEDHDGAFFALEASQWVAHEGGTNAQGLHYDLQGIHKLADDVLRPWVSTLDSYNEGVDRALGVKANWDRFLQVFAIGGIIVLALLCAPLGAVAVGFVTGVAGIALAVHDVMEADRLEALYRSLEDPEAILSWQDVQLARLMADLSIAFSIFDVVGVGKGARAIVTGARTALREAAEVGIRATVRLSIRSARRAVLANMAEEVLRNAVRQAAQHAAIAGAMQAVLPVVITPVLVPWIRGVALEHGTLSSVDAALGQLAAGQPATPVPVSGVLPGEVGTSDAQDEEAYDSGEWFADPSTAASINPAEWAGPPLMDGGVSP